MTSPGPLNRPQSGQPVNKLWRDVAALVDDNRRLRAELDTIRRSLGGRRKMDVEGGGTSQFRGEYLDTVVYIVGDVVIVSSGANAGTYICVSDNPGAAHSPWAGGGYWVKFFSGNALGQWM